PDGGSVTTSHHQQSQHRTNFSRQFLSGAAERTHAPKSRQGDNPKADNNSLRPPGDYTIPTPAACSHLLGANGRHTSVTKQQREDRPPNVNRGIQTRLPVTRSGLTKGEHQDAQCHAKTQPER